MGESSKSQGIKGCKNTFTWTRNLTTELMLLYEQHTCLHRVQSQEYHNKMLRHKALQEIAACLNKGTLYNLQAEDIQKKIHGIRSQYMNELNKVKKSKASGSGTDDIYVPKLWCFDLLHFLNDSASVVQTGDSNLNSEEEDTNEDDNLEMIYNGPIENIPNTILTSPEPCDTPRRGPSRASVDNGVEKKKRKRNTAADEVKGLLSTATQALKVLDGTEGEVENDKTAFCSMLGIEMATIEDDEILDDFKEAVMIALFQAKRKYREKKKTM